MEFTLLNLIQYIEVLSFVIIKINKNIRSVENLQGSNLKDRYTQATFSGCLDLCQYKCQGNQKGHIQSDPTHKEDNKNRNGDIRDCLKIRYLCNVIEYRDTRRQFNLRKFTMVSSTHKSPYLKYEIYPLLLEQKMIFLTISNVFNMHLI